MTHTKIPHNFTYPQLSYDASPNTQPYIKLTFYFNKLPHVSHEQFYRHWETVHADLTVATKDFAICNLQRYVQFSQTPSMKSLIKKDLKELEILEFDGCSEMWVKNWEDWVRFYNSPDYSKALGPDCKHFMVMPISIMAGYDNLIFGKAVEGSGGRDGILEWSGGGVEGKVEDAGSSVEHVETV